MKKIFFGVLLTFLLVGCVTVPEKKDQSAFKAVSPRSILVVPIANTTLDVDAPNYLLSSLPIPLAEKGYYVFPVNTVKYLLEQEGFYEGDQIQQQSPAELARLFGADAVLFVTINRWDAQYAVISTTVTVEFEYRMIGKNGEEFWSETKQMAYTPDLNTNGGPIVFLLSALVNSIVARAAPNYLPLTKQANQVVFVTGTNAIPDGPYK